MGYEPRLRASLVGGVEVAGSKGQAGSNFDYLWTNLKLQAQRRGLARARVGVELVPPSYLLLYTHY